MDKETITGLKQESEARCRLYFDQLTTLQQQAQQMEVTLERERGKLQAYAEIEGAWVDPKPDAVSPTLDVQPTPPARPEASLIPVPPSLKPAKVAKEK